MLELPLVLIAGVLGSIHCVGMCGPFALTIGAGSTSWRANVSRQLVYSGGRIFTYSALGAVAGFAGWRLRQLAPTLTSAAALLAIVAGALLLYQGLKATGVGRFFRRKKTSCGSAPVCGSEFLATFLRGPGLGNVFLAGLFTGLLPCGLVYSFVALAASSAQLTWGVAVMVAFGLGTAPTMIVLGCGGWAASAQWAQAMRQMAAWCVVLTGLISMARGFGFVPWLSWLGGDGCVFCH